MNVKLFNSAEIVQVLAQQSSSRKNMKEAFVSHVGLVSLGIDKERVRTGRKL